MTAFCAALANEATAQDASIVLNEQIQLGDVFSGQTLNVIDARQQVTASTTAMGNQITGGTEGRDVFVRNRQTGFAAAVAQTRLNMQGQNNGRTTVVTQARGNEASIAANNATLSLDSAQTSYGPSRASTQTEDPQAHHLNGMTLTSAAYGNNLSAGGRNTLVEGAIGQTSTSSTVAQTFAPARYVPGQTQLHSDATANSVQINTTGVSDQDVAITQNSQSWVGSSSNLSGANVWNAATTASGAANRVSLYNNGGSQVIALDQTSSSTVDVRAKSYAYDYGDMRAIADGVGNQATVGNADIWVEIDNRQINTGGVAVSADLSGHNGYDAYVGANATGNAVTGYACSDCGGVVRATNSQTNASSISASATTNLTGTNRAVITGTTATGNSASFYVTRPGG